MQGLVGEKGEKKQGNILKEERANHRRGMSHKKRGECFKKINSIKNNDEE